MKRLIKYLKELFALYVVRRMYVVTQETRGVKYYYMGSNSRWTPMFEGAKKYKKKPEHLAWLGVFYKIETYYA